MVHPWLHVLRIYQRRNFHFTQIPEVGIDGRILMWDFIVLGSQGATGFPGAAGRTGPPGPSVSKSLQNTSSFTQAKPSGF